MKRFRIFLSIGFLILSIIVAGLAFGLFKPGGRYNIDRYIDSHLQDTLLTNVVTFMGERPPHTDHITRHLPVHRPFFIREAKRYEFYKYYVDNDNNHFFYIIRPARHATGHHRAVGGWMRIDENAQILQYYEIFVTRVLAEDSLKALAPYLFEKLISKDYSSLNHTHPAIEWPDGRLLYHPEKKEWRYDVKTDQP